MENFFNYISQPLSPKDVELWFKSNNMIPEKMELYYDFSHTLNIIILTTYLGGETGLKDVNINLTDEDNKNHFIWCWGKTIDNFNKENIKFNKDGGHFDYFESFFEDTFYKQNNDKVKSSIGFFFDDLFNYKKSFTKSDLDMVTTIYKVLDKHIGH